MTGSLSRAEGACGPAGLSGRGIAAGLGRAKPALERMDA